MSLVNNVLRDLEDRSGLVSTTEQGVIGDLRSAQDYAEESRRFRSRLAASLAAIVCLTAVGLLMEQTFYRFIDTNGAVSISSEPAVAVQGNEPENRVAAVSNAVPEPEDRSQRAADDPELALKLDTVTLRIPVEAENVSASVAPETSSAAPVQGSRLIALEHRSTDNASDIYLSLTSPPDYRLHILQDPDRLLVQFRRLAFDGEVMEKFTPDGLIAGMRFAEQGDVSKLIFDLTGPVVVDTADLGQQASGAFDFKIRLSVKDESRSDPAPIAEDTVERMELTVPVVEEAMPIQKTIRQPDPVYVAQETFRNGLDAYRIGDARGAARLFEQVLALHPQHLQARRLLASVLAELHDSEGAKRVLAEGLRYQQSDPSLVKSYARILFDEGHLAQALQMLSRSLPAVSADPEYHALAAAILQRQGKHAQAVEIYRQLLQLNSGNGIWWTGLAISLEGMGKKSEALEAFQRAGNDSSVPPDVARYVQERINALTRARL